MDYRLYSRKLFDALDPGGRELRHLQRRLQRDIEGQLRDAALTRLREIVVELNQRGHHLVGTGDDPTVADSAYRDDRVGPGTGLQLSCGLEVRATVVLPGADPPSAPRHTTSDRERYFERVELAATREELGGGLAPGELDRICLWVYRFESELDRGGLSQYFWSAAGDRAGETVAALRRVGAREHAELLEQAMAAFPGGGPPAEQDERVAVMQGLEPAFWGRLSDLDERIGPSREDLPALVGLLLAREEKR